MDSQLATIKSNGPAALAVRREYESALREMVIGGRKLTAEQINGRMAFAMQQGLDPISEVHTITDRDGKTMAHSMGINGLRRKNLESLGDNTQTIDIEFVELPKDKMMADWLFAFECRLRDSVSYRTWQRRVIEVGRTLKEVLGNLDYQTIIEACGPAPVTVGVGVVYKSEISEYKDKNFNPVERAKKRAEVNARHHRFPTNTPVYEGGEIVTESIDAAYTESAPAAAPALSQPAAPKQSAAKNLSDLGFDTPEEPEMPEMPGDFVDAPAAPAAEPEPVYVSDDAVQRIVDEIRNAMDLYANRPGITQSQHNMLAPHIEAAFKAGDKEAKRHAVLKALTGHTSIKELEPTTAKCLYHWLRPYQDAAKVWQINDQARAKLNQLVAELDKANQPSLI